ncbi:MAG TPA: (4Fe-4S)-binding protein [Gaiellaceae bacterium]
MSVREYATDDLVVEWRPSLCYHSQNCVRALPLVFDKERRPWIDPTQATADELEAAVDGCPSGALRSRRLRGEAPPAATEVEIEASADGPLLVRGPIRIVQPDGSVEEVPRAAFCRCGHSGNKPFCDGSHREVGFRS